MTKRVSFFYYCILSMLFLSQVCYSKFPTDVYVVDNIAGVYAPAFKSRVNIKTLNSIKSKDQAAVIVLTGKQIQTLNQTNKKSLKKLYSKGWVYILTDVDAEQINMLHEILDDGQKFITDSSGKNTMEAFGLSNRPGQGVDSGYGQARIHLLNNYNGANKARLLSKRAASLYKWANERLNAPEKNVSHNTLQLDSSGSEVLTDLVSAWPDSNLFYYQDGGNQSLFQCNVSVWQAYQVSTQYDYYYIQQFCNLTPQNTYKVHGKKLEKSWGLYDDWSDESWSLTSQYCYPNDNAGDEYTACDLHDYVTNYGINLVPYYADSSKGADGDASKIILATEAPSTTQNNTTVTEGVSYSIGGSVVAGYNAASVSVSAGVTISDSTTTTIPDVTIQNQSNTAGNNASWDYVMPKVAYIDDICTNTMYSPTNSQITTFTPQQQMVWQVNSSYRGQEGFDGFFNVDMNFTVNIDTSTMYVDHKGTVNVTNKSDCNMSGCSCAIINNSSEYSSGTYIMSIPVPSTDYQDPDS